MIRRRLIARRAKGCPVRNAAQFEKAKEFLKSVHKDGKVVEGNGYFIQPTVVRVIKEGAMLVDEEQFAPILPVIKFDEIDDVVQRANNSVYGLGGSVWSADSERAYEIARKIDSGTVWINHHGDLKPNVPFGGAKQSGIGAELATDGMLEFSQTSVINLSKEPVV